MQRSRRLVGLGYARIRGRRVVLCRGQRSLAVLFLLLLAHALSRRALSWLFARRLGGSSDDRAAWMLEGTLAKGRAAANRREAEHAAHRFAVRARLAEHVVPLASEQLRRAGLDAVVVGAGGVGAVERDGRAFLEPVDDHSPEDVAAALKVVKPASSVLGVAFQRREFQNEFPQTPRLEPRITGRFEERPARACILSFARFEAERLVSEPDMAEQSAEGTTFLSHRRVRQMHAELIVAHARARELHRSSFAVPPCRQREPSSQRLLQHSIPFQLQLELVHTICFNFTSCQLQCNWQLESSSFTRCRRSAVPSM
eukprot:1041966-Rhodomonas_salina.1